MDKPTVFGVCFALPWLWTLFQLVVIGDPVYAVYLVLFCTVLNFLKTSAGDSDVGDQVGELETVCLMSSGDPLRPDEVSPVVDPLDHKLAGGDFSALVAKPGGPVVEVKPDSPVVVAKPGGPIVAKSDGPVVVAKPDGPVVVAKPGGPAVEAKPGGPIVAKSDGPVVVAKPEGPVVVAKPDGLVVVAKPVGPVDVAKPDGPVVVAKPGGPVVAAKAVLPAGDHFRSRVRMGVSAGPVPPRKDAGQLKLGDIRRPFTVPPRELCVLDGDSPLPDPAFFARNRYFYIRHRHHWREERRKMDFHPGLSFVEEELFVPRAVENTAVCTVRGKNGRRKGCKLLQRIKRLFGGRKRKS